MTPFDMLFHHYVVVTCAHLLLISRHHTHTHHCYLFTLVVFAVAPRCRPWPPAPPGHRFWQTLTFSVTLTWFSIVPTSVRLPTNRCSQWHQDYRYLDRLKRSRWYRLLYIRSVCLSMHLRPVVALLYLSVVLYLTDTVCICISMWTTCSDLWETKPRAGSGVVRMDPLRFLAACRTRRLNQV